MDVLLAGGACACENFAEMLFMPSLLAATGASASGALAWSAVAPSAQVFGPTIRSTSDTSTIALTFDDGPDAQVTPQLLDLLDRHKIRATFFLIGRHIRLLPGIAAEIAARGHAVGNHTDTHPALTFCSPSHIAAEIDRCDSAFQSVMGRTPLWMRPPFGYRGPQLSWIVRERRKNGIVMWSRSARDWKSQPAERVIKRLRSVRGGDIVLLHDGDHRASECDRRHTLSALEHWLPRWKDAGMRFVHLDDMVSQNRDPL
jgi:peptidoglycan/xylan/chitin deacetylase (PgdA/CDA1 family)